MLLVGWVIAFLLASNKKTERTKSFLFDIKLATLHNLGESSWEYSACIEDSIARLSAKVCCIVSFYLSCVRLRGCCIAVRFPPRECEA